MKRWEKKLQTAVPCWQGVPQVMVGLINEFKQVKEIAQLNSD